MTETAVPRRPTKPGWIPIDPPHDHCEAWLVDRGSRCVLVLSSVAEDPDGHWWYHLSVGRVTNLVDKRFAVPTDSDLDYARQGFGMQDAIENTPEDAPARNLWMLYPKPDEEE